MSDSEPSTATKVVKSVETITEEVADFEQSVESVGQKLLSAVTTSIPKELEVSDKIYHIVKDDLRGFDVDVSNLIVLVTKVVEICDRFKALNGESNILQTGDHALHLLSNVLSLRSKNNA